MQAIVNLRGVSAKLYYICALKRKFKAFLSHLSGTSDEVQRIAANVRREAGRNRRAQVGFTGYQEHVQSPGGWTSLQIICLIEHKTRERCPLPVYQTAFHALSANGLRRG